MRNSDSHYSQTDQTSHQATNRSNSQVNYKKDSLDNKAIKTKLILMVVLPFLTLIYFPISMFMDKQQDNQEVLYIKHATSLIDNIRNIVHELQKERGLTAGYLNYPKEFKRQLELQYEETDFYMDQFEGISNEAISHFNTDEAYYKGLKSEIEELRKNYLGVVIQREYVKDKNIEISLAISTYTQLNDESLKLIGQIKYPIKHNELSNIFNTYVSFLSGKEHAGIERAVLNSKIKDGIHNKINYSEQRKSIRKQQEYFKAFLDAASQKTIDFHRNTMNHPSVSKVISLRNVSLIDGESTHFTMDSQQWYTTATKRIDLLKLVGDFIADGIDDTVNTLIKKNRTQLTIFSIATLVVVFLLVMFTVFIVKNVVNQLLKYKKDNADQNWLRDGQSTINSLTSGENDVHDLSNKTIKFICEYLNFNIGAIYVCETDSYKMNASYGYEKAKNISNSFKKGEGVIGQVVIEKQWVILEELPEDYSLSIQSGLGNSKPKQILIYPITLDGNVVAVLELASLAIINDRDIEFIRSVDVSLGISITSSKSSETIRSLLIETEIKSSELLDKTDELEASNLDMKKKTMLLHESEKTLIDKNRMLADNSKSLELEKRSVVDKNREIERKAQELEVVSKYKSEFLANMSHELRTPMNSLLILAKMLGDNKESNLTKKQLEWINIIENSGNELITLINDILDLSKVEAGKLIIVNSSIVIEKYISSFKSKFQYMADKKNIKLKLDNSLNKGSILKSDEQRVSQILSNFLSNAIKFTPEGTVTLHVKRPGKSTNFNNKSLNENNAVTFDVIDTGVGVSDEDKEKIFEAFQQADGSISRNYGGTGLGLTISKQLCNLLGGEIQVKSKINEGSTFSLILPVEPPLLNKKNESNESNLQTHLSENKNTSTLFEKPISDDDEVTGNKSNQILIVEDNENFAKILLGLAQENGFNGLHTSLGKKGLALAKKHLPSAIILDVNLPDIQGDEVLKQLKSDKMTKNIPVHIISAEMRDEKYLINGAIEFLEKPIAEEQLSRIFTSLKKNSLDDKSLLIIEDDNSTIVAIRELLENKNISISVAENLREARDLFEQKEFDCILLDILLPDGSGFDFIKELNSKNPNLPPVIVHTGKDLDEDERKNLKSVSESIIIKGQHSPSLLSSEIVLFINKIKSDMSNDAKVEPSTNANANASANASVNVIENKPLEKIQMPDVITSTIENLNTDEFKGKRILLADDNIRNVYSLSACLSEYDMEVVVAKNGQEALDLLDKEPIDLILMDIMMPVMDGYTAIQHIRKMDNFMDLPIIVVTANAMAGEKEKCINYGANDIVFKPVNIDILLSSMRKYLNKE